MNRKDLPELENIKVVEKHLEKNEKGLQYPEKKIKTFEKNANEWNKDFLDNIARIEKMIKDLEEKFE